MPQAISTEVLTEKYAKGNETKVDEVLVRLAKALAEIAAPKQRKKQAGQVLWAMQHGFIPAGRVCSTAGTSLQSMLINCFVQPVGDSITETQSPGPSSPTCAPTTAAGCARSCPC